MKKTTLVIMALIALSSCNKEKEIKIVEPPKEIILNVVHNIDGDVGAFCSAKNEKIKISFKKNDDQLLPGIEYEIPIKINFSSSSDIKAGRGYNDYGPSMEIEFLDKEGKNIEGCSTKMKSSYTDLASLIKSGNKEEWVTFSGRYMVNFLNEDKSFEESKSFISAISKATSARIKSEIIEEKTEPKPSQSETNAAKVNDGKSSSNSSSGSDCDNFLIDYGKFMDQYIVLLKKQKANPTDMSIMSEYTAMATEAGSWAKKTANCAADPQFAAKFAAIAMKIVNGMR